MLRRAALVLVLAVPAVAAGQTATLVGVVRDPSGETLPAANVYLSGTTRGTSADARGRFRIEGVALGAHRLVASVLGYTAQAVDLVVRSPGDVEVVFTLEPTALDLGAVEVAARRDRRWARRLAAFQRQLFGETLAADSVVLLNPYVLQFESRWGTLTARAAAPLVIDNRALGYRLTYDLQTFSASPERVHYDGDERFEALAPTDSAEAARWEAARERAYRGSLRHFLRALVEDRVEEEGFRLIHRPGAGPNPEPFGRGAFADRQSPTSPPRLLTPDGAEVSFWFRGLLDVVYEREPESPAYLQSSWFRERRGRPLPAQTSSLLLDRGPALLDADGEPADPLSIVEMGYFAFERLADLVPREYRPATR